MLMFNISRNWAITPIYEGKIQDAHSKKSISPATKPTVTPTATPAPHTYTMTYTYDGDGNLVKSVLEDVVTYYVGSIKKMIVRGSQQNERN